MNEHEAGMRFIFNGLFYWREPPLHSPVHVHQWWHNIWSHDHPTASFIGHLHCYEDQMLSIGLIQISSTSKNP